MRFQGRAGFRRQHDDGRVFGERIPVLDGDFITGLQAAKNSDPAAGAHLGLLVRGDRDFRRHGLPVTNHGDDAVPFFIDGDGDVREWLFPRRRVRAVPLERSCLAAAIPWGW